MTFEASVDGASLDDKCSLARSIDGKILLSEVKGDGRLATINGCFGLWVDSGNFRAKC
jgi:hypothetical protein